MALYIKGPDSAKSCCECSARPTPCDSCFVCPISIITNVTGGFVNITTGISQSSIDFFVPIGTPGIGDPIVYFQLPTSGNQINASWNGAAVEGQVFDCVTMSLLGYDPTTPFSPYVICSQFQTPPCPPSFFSFSCGGSVATGCLLGIAQLNGGPGAYNSTLILSY